MTSRSRSQRIAAWLMAALLALVVGEPLRVHECPMHLRSVAATTATTAEHAGGAHAAGDEGSGHRESGHASAHDADAPQERHDGDHRCDCLGTCCTVAPVATPQVAAVRTSVVQVAAPTIVARAPLTAVPAGEHVLPFAIGPPTLG